MAHLPDDSNSVRMHIRGIMTDPASNMPVVILEHLEEKSTFLPIWIGLCEASSIALEMEKVKTPRPMTHDLVLSVVSALSCRVESVFIHTLSENVFYAAVIIRIGDGQTRELDSRPSDALAVALRADAPVYVGHDVLREAHTPDLTDDEDLKSLLEGLRPEDLGQYEM